MTQTDTNNPFLSVDFGESGGRFEWMTSQEAIDWINKTRDEWAWVSSQGQNATNQAWSTVANPLNNAVSNLQQAQNYLNQGQHQNVTGHIANAKSQMEGLFKPYPWLLPEQAQRRFVEEMRDAGKPLDAALIVANWMQHDMNGSPIRVVVSALLQWELYERGIKDRIKTENAALKRLAGDMQTALTEYRESERSQNGRYDAFHAQLTEQSANQQTTFEGEQVARANEWKKQIDDTQAELSRLKETYDKHMALAAPVEYWEGKRKKHGLWTLVSFIATLVCMIGLGFFLHSELQDVGKTVEENRVAAVAIITKTSTQQSNTGKSVATPSTQTQAPGAGHDLPVALPSASLLESSATYKLGSFILLATLSFWFIRLLVRVFLSNLHLENDAAERVTMAKTYLAMIRDDALPKGENISTVLAALFRPTGDGIVKDEGLPPTAMEWLTKLGGK